MDVQLVVQVGGIGILVAALYVVLEQTGRKEQGLLVVLCGVVAVLTVVMTRVADFIQAVQTLFRLP